MTTELPSSETDSLRLRIEELFRALNDHDVDAIVALHAPDAVFRDPSKPHAATGRAAIAEEFRAIFRAFPDIHYPTDEIRLYVADDHRAAASWRFTGTMTGRIDPPGYAPTGKSCSVEGVCLYELTDDPQTGTTLLARHTAIYDTMGVLQELGIMPRPESSAAKLTASLQRTSVAVSHALHRQPAHQR